MQDEINTTDKEIDRMVYKLYELTEDEMEIIKKKIGWNGKTKWAFED